MNLDFTFERRLELTRKEERELGREEGFTRAIISLLKKEKITLKEAAEELGLKENQVLELVKDSNNKYE